MRKGIHQWSFPTGLSLEQMMAEARRAGFEGIELNLSLGEEVAGTPATPASELKLGEVPGPTLRSTPADSRRIAAMAAGQGLAIPSLATALHWRFPLTEPDPMGKVSKRGEPQRPDLNVENLL
jgi:L-ribulose-5-phosphate 3-epimerase